MGSAGIFSLFAHTPVVLISRWGPQEIITKQNAIHTSATNDFVLFIFKYLWKTLAGGQGWVGIAAGDGAI